MHLKHLEPVDFDISEYPTAHRLQITRHAHGTNECTDSNSLQNKQVVDSFFGIASKFSFLCGISINTKVDGITLFMRAMNSSSSSSSEDQEVPILFCV